MPDPFLHPAPLRLRTVVLRHDLPDGSGHWDWLIARSPDPSSTLVSFRLNHPFDDEACSGFEAERIADHRGAYLDYEGPVRNARGRVKRTASGLARIDLDSPDRFEVELELGGASGRWIAVKTHGATWRFTRQGVVR